MKNKELDTIPQPEKTSAWPEHLKLITGGKGPENPNWLGELMRGTVFLCRARNHDPREAIPRWACGEFFVNRNIDGEAVQLYMKVGEEGRWIWAHALDFSRDFMLVKIIQTAEAFHESPGVEQPDQPS